MNVRIAMRWLIHKRFVEAKAFDENVDDVASFLAGDDHAVARRRIALVRDIGGEVG